MLARTIAVAVVVALVAPSAARAHQDPPGCSQSGVAMVLAAFRSDGTTPVSGSIQDCEQIFYRVTLSKVLPNDATVCAFSGGSLTVTTPDGALIVVDSNVPCVGGTAGGCVTSISSGLISYTASPADVSGGLVTAQASYSGGVTHDSVGDNSVSASVSRNTPVVACAATTSTSSSKSTSSTTTTLPKSVCTSAKFLAASKLALALAKCEAKAVKGGVAVVQECRDKAIAKFVSKWTAAQSKPDCLTSDDQSSIQDLIDACVTSLTNSLLPSQNP